MARWKEDVTWLQNLPEGWTYLLVQKGEDVPNIGREPHSFLYWIINFYDLIREDLFYVFIQGNPFDHCPYFLDALDDENIWANTEGYVELGDKPHVTNAHGSPAHNGLPVGQYYTKWFKKEFPAEGVRFVAGGQFAVKGSAIKQRSREFYEELFNDILEKPDSVPWVLERTWETIFTHAPSREG